MPSRFYIHVLEEDADYVRLHDVAITDHLTKQLALLLQSMRAADLRKEKVNSHGISPDASVDAYNKAEEAKRVHEATFGTEEERRAQVASIQAATQQNSMIPVIPTRTYNK
jgi:hypothetical protein